MKARKQVKAPQKALLKKGQEARSKRLQIVKLEERIAPRLARNHNETLVRNLG